MLRARNRSPFAASKLAFAAALAVLAASSASAGNTLSVDWSTIDAGGGTSTGGNYSVSGTIGQVDADPLQPSSGGNFALTGGFWVVANATTPASDLIFKDGFEAAIP